MVFQLFPKEEYWLTSPYTASQAIDALAENVMRQDFITYGFFAAFLDRKMKIYKFFEGSINDLDFKISHKQYWHARASGFINSIPSINGAISEVGSGSVVHINCCASKWMYLSAILRLGMFLFIIGTHAPLIVLIIFILLYIIFLFVQRYLYIRRLRKDKEQLKLIFRAEELEALL